MLRVCIRTGIRTIQKICETLQGCMHSHKATSKHETLKADTTTSTKRAPSSSPDKNAHDHTVTQTVHTMPSFSHTLQSHCTAFQAICETELLSNSHTLRQHNGFCSEELAAVASPASLTGCIKTRPALHGLLCTPSTYQSIIFL